MPLASLRQPPGRGLVPHLLEHLRRGTDEHDAGGGAGARELGVLGEEAVAGVNGVGAVPAGDVDDAGDVEVGGDRVERFV